MTDDIAILSNGSFVQVVYLGDGSRPWLGGLEKSEVKKLLLRQIQSTSSEEDLQSFSESFSSDDGSYDKYSKFLWKANPGMRERNF